jgi:hypothetical protein
MQCRATTDRERKAMRKPNLPNGTAFLARELAQGESAALFRAVRKNAYRPSTRQMLHSCRMDSLRTYRKYTKANHE